MRFDFSIYADNVEELGDALGAIRTAIPADVFDTQRRGFSIIARPDYTEAGSGTVTHTRPPAPVAPIDTAASADAPAANAPAPAPARTRTRRTNAQIAADEAAAKAAAESKAPAPGAPDDVGGDAENDDPLGLGSDAEPEPAAPPELTPAEAKLKALEVLREAFALPGGPAAVKKCQAAYGVAKFIEVPDASGGGLLQKARQILAELKAAA